MFYSPKSKISGNVIIVAIDEKSLKELGRWDSWSRNKFPEIINKIKRYGPKVIAIDILFSETSHDDSKIINFLKNTVGAFAVDFDFDRKSIISEYLKKSAFENVIYNNTLIISSNSAILPFESLLKNFLALGHINMFPDDDGILRRELVGIKFGDLIYPSFAIQIYRIYKNIDIEDVLFVPGKTLYIKEQRIDLDSSSTVLINYKGKEGIFPVYSLSDIYFNKLNGEIFKNKIVLVGATAVGLYDLRVTPLSQNMPGIEKHAHVIENLIENRFVKRVDNKILYLTIFLIFIIYSISGKVFKSKGITIIGFSIFTGYLLIAFILFSKFGVWINIVYPFFTNLSLFLTVVLYKFVIEEAQSRNIRKIFSSYVSDKIVNELIKNPEMAKLGGTKKEITVLFADVRGFTNFSERHDPEEVVSYLNELLSTMTDVIMEHDGTLDKFVGDEIMALWNVPLDQKEHALKAVICAIEMIRKNRLLAEKWEREGKEALYIGIGINTGEAVVGNMGAEGKKMDYTAIGDTVNLGARIEALTRSLDAEILISETTYERIKDFIKELKNVNIIQCSPIQVKGKKDFIVVYKIEVK